MPRYNQHSFTKKQWQKRLPHEQTPAEIKKLCAEIRKTWSPATRRSRQVFYKEEKLIAEVAERCLSIELPYQPEMPQGNWG